MRGKNTMITCPTCGSDDLSRVGERSGALELVCEACGHQWSRVPAQPCPRCGSGDFEVGEQPGWSYDDLDDARDVGHAQADWHYVDYEVVRCRNCRHRWERPAGVRPPPARSSAVVTDRDASTASDPDRGDKP